VSGVTRKRNSRKTRRRGKTSAPGWAWMLFGLSIGLAVAAGIYVSDRPASVPSPPAVAEPMSQRSEAAAPAVVEEEHPARRFDFYEMLPKFEVVIPERETDAKADTTPTALEQPGSYVLQAGSFSQFGDADRMKARLALLGIPSRIQKVTIDDSTYHRVRVGPVGDLNEVNRLRRQLYDAKIEILLIRLPN
jgi:cell division protein FtsN